MSAYKPPIVDDIRATIKFLEDLMKNPNEQVDPRWFLPYEVDEKPKLKLVKEDGDEQQD